MRRKWNLYFFFGVEVTPLVLLLVFSIFPLLIFGGGGGGGGNLVLDQIDERNFNKEPLPKSLASKILTKGSLRDLERNDEKFSRWLKTTLPEPFQPYHSFSHPNNNRGQQYNYNNNINNNNKGGRGYFNRRAGRRRRNHPTKSPFASADEPIYPPEDHLKQLSKNITTILDSLLKGYDRKVRPDYGGDPVKVGVTMYVLSISSISEVLMDFTLDFYFRQMWKDPRLRFEGAGGISTLSVGSEYLKSIWVPDTFFVNEKTSYFHTATTSNEFLRITKDGEVLRSIRLTVTATCNMDLHHFPMDSQLCNVEIESYGYGMADIMYFWARGATSVGVSSEVSLPQFRVLGFRQKVADIYLLTGNYSRLACEIQFVRSMGFYLIQVYIPSSLIVIMSWVSFWLNRNASPARVPLGITTVLTMTTLMSSVNKELPKISYVKSIDIFLGTCFVMVFAALLEYATVGYLAKRIQMRKNHFAALQKMALELQKERAEQLRQQEAADEAIRLFHMQQTRHHPRTPGGGGQNSTYGTLGMPSSSSGVGGGRPVSSMSNMSHHHPHHQIGSPYPPPNVAQMKNASTADSHTHSHPSYHRSHSTLPPPGGGGGGHQSTSSASNYYMAQTPTTLHRRRDAAGNNPDMSMQQSRPHSRHQHYQEHGPIPPPLPPPRPREKDEDSIMLEKTLQKIRIQVNSNQICGIAPSDIDKYSRVIFPVCFVCFHLFYWIVYMHISTVDVSDLVLIVPES